MTDKTTLAALDECATQVFIDRDKIAAFYDVRIVFASYSEVLASLAAAMIKNNVYPAETVGRLLGDMMASALTRKSTTECQRTFATDVVVRGKQ